MVVVVGGGGEGGREDNQQFWHESACSYTRPRWNCSADYEGKPIEETAGLAIDNGSKLPRGIGEQQSEKSRAT